MTAPKKQDSSQADTLEVILERIESIDENVQEILDRLSDYVDSTRYGAEWYPDRYSYDDRMCGGSPKGL